jgi:NAD-dependent deacetylase
VVVFTGAGMSADSGVPTFRDDPTGLWANFDSGRLATLEGFQADPGLVWGWYEWRRRQVRRAVPHPGHLAVAAIAERVPRTTVITQNVDDLHERAGSRDVIHLHGSLSTPHCVAEAAHPAILDDDPGSETILMTEQRRIPPPRCTFCGALVRPGVVWFGELLPEVAYSAAMKAATTCDVLLTVGTSAMVFPAAELPRHAVRYGAAVIQVNPVPTSLDLFCEVNLYGTAARVLPALATAVG